MLHWVAMPVRQASRQIKGKTNYMYMKLTPHRSALRGGCKDLKVQVKTIATWLQVQKVFFYVGICFSPPSVLTFLLKPHIQAVMSKATTSGESIIKIRISLLLVFHEGRKDLILITPLHNIGR